MNYLQPYENKIAKLRQELKAKQKHLSELRKLKYDPSETMVLNLIQKLQLETIDLDKRIKIELRK